MNKQSHKKQTQKPHSLFVVLLMLLRALEIIVAYQEKDKTEVGF